MNDKSKLVPDDKQPNLCRQSSIAAAGGPGESQAIDLPTGGGGPIDPALSNVFGNEDAMSTASSESYVSESSCGEEVGDEGSSDALCREGGLTGPEAVDVLQRQVDGLCERISRLWGDLAKASDSYEGYAIFEQIESEENQVYTLLRRIQRYRNYR